MYESDISDIYISYHTTLYYLDYRRSYYLSVISEILPSNLIKDIPKDIYVILMNL